MPRGLKVDSLKSICIDNICKNMKSFWYEKYWKDISSIPERVISEVGPFEYLPGYLVNDITTKLERINRNVEDQVRSSLITSTLRRFDMVIPVNGTSLVWKLISLKCQDTLTELKLYGYKDESNSMMNVLKSLRNLEVLVLDCTIAGNDILAVIGSHCDKLRKLDVGHNVNIGDISMEYLFLNKTSEDGVHSYGKCTQLESLIVEHTNVGEAGLEIALRNAQNLQELVTHCNVLSVLEKMHQYDLEANAPLVQCNLTAIKAGCDGVFLGNKRLKHLLSIASVVCPRLASVFLDVKWDEDVEDVFEPLCRLKNLKNLEITCHREQQRAALFSEVVPVLSVSGQSIKRLHLNVFPWVDVGVIGVCCPLLEDLHIEASRRSSGDQGAELGNKIFVPPAYKLRPFTFLKYFNVNIYPSDLNQRPSFDVTPSQWKDILSSRHLETLYITRSSTLTYSLLSEVLKADQEFPNLRKLNLYYCPNITRGFVQSFLDLSNPLEEINVGRCKKITKSDFDSLEFFCKINGFDVAMTFSDMWPVFA